ncbi:phosphomannomutase/phosphoglucomutase [Formicincola oecophyllae]|uniref:Phosphomannomutase/phosphoglucomutase n=1 Tax=Formicincola oecophyllae TaxID=2558361 RepID=A0A4Y6U6H2_9PROT|nr:phosphomannomutase/phosphoglucomutase [Formicincola oecophyllae]QDH12949.1 phosphomannomutase/phosphoglucomutase [Formicincola oecophyllae]
MNTPTSRFTHQFNPTILREYDMRGIVGETLFPADAYALGRVFGTKVRQGGGRCVAVGRDGRLSSKELENELVRGLRDSGIHVRRIGMGPTPMLYFANAATGTDGAIMVTGSHNPASHNGFKMVLGGKPFFGAMIKELGAAASQGAVMGGQGSEERIDPRHDYVTRILRDYDGPSHEAAKGLKIVWDNGNSCAGEVLGKLVEALPGEHIVLYPEVDGTFPNHHPDPTVAENLADLVAAVRQHKADFGVAFDGDADRIGLVDDEGHILWGDQILAILASDLLRQRPGETIIADVKASQVLFDEVKRAGGRPHMERTGHSLVKQAMAETGAPLAGEMSGHIFYADKWYGFDDALYAAVRAMGVVSRLQGRLSDTRKRLPAMVSTPELRFPCDDARKFAVVKEVAAHLAQEGADVTTIDGVRVNTADGWWLLRPSNTQAVLVARLEASTAEGLERLKADFTRHLGACGVKAPEVTP